MAMKKCNSKSHIPKRRNFVALHARNLKGGRHSDRRDRRSGNQGWLEQGLDEADEMSTSRDSELNRDRHNEERNRP